MMLLQMPHLQKMEMMKLDPDDYMLAVVVVLSIISSIQGFGWYFLVSKVAAARSDFFSCFPGSIIGIHTDRCSRRLFIKFCLIVLYGSKKYTQET
jgi:hypothetical protein